MQTTYCELNYLHLEKMCVGQNTVYVSYKNIHSNIKLIFTTFLK